MANMASSYADPMFKFAYQSLTKFHVLVLKHSNFLTRSFGKLSTAISSIII